MTRSDRVCVGQIGGAHGVRGIVKVKPFTARPANVAAYGPVSDAEGRRRLVLRLLSLHKGQWRARIDGVEDRAAAEALRGTRLYVDRARLPDPGEDEFYHADLIGLAVELPDGTPFGTVRGLDDHGGGGVIEVTRPDGSAVVVPFTKAAVPVVDPAAGRLVIDPPPGLLEPPDHRPENEQDGPADAADGDGGG